MIRSVIYPDITPEENQRRLDTIRKVGEQILYNILSDPERRDAFLNNKAPVIK